MKYAMLDVETTDIADGQIPVTLFWGLAIEGEDYRRFEDTNELLHFLNRHSPLKLLHHANFDVIQLLRDGTRNLHIVRSHAQRIIQCKLGEHQMYNTACMFPCPLADLMAAYGHKKTSLEFLDKRNYDDCVLGLDVVLRLSSKFEELIGESPLHRHTVASTSFHACQKIAGKLATDLLHEQSYRGGKVECYDTRPFVCDDYDINSSYPASFLDAPDKGKLLHCRVKTKDFFGPFFHAQNRDRLCFPIGEFDTWIYEDVYERYIKPHSDRHELRVIESFAIDLTWLKSCSSLIQKLYKLKQECGDDGAIRLVAKLALNAIYGRIGLRGERERCRILPYPPDGDDITCYEFATDRWICFDKLPIVPRANYPLAAYITDNARGRLFAACKQVEAIYCDTDSVYTPHLGLTPSPVGSGLGEWKRGATPEIFKGNNVKDYFKRGLEPTNRRVKGGTEKIQWTLKRFASGKTAKLVTREFSGRLHKRVLLATGETTPITV